jgi:type I restriction enzyme S subunit
MKKKEIFTTENTENTEVDSVASVRSVVNTEDLPDGFQMTELGPLPEDWRVVRLGEVAQFQTGQREKGGARTDQGIISVGGEHITEDGQINFTSSPKYISREFFQNMATGKVNPGDILVVKDGARTGKSAFARQVPPTGMAVNEHVFIIRVHDQNAVVPEYVAFWFRSKMAWDQIRSAYHGLIGGINRREVTKFLLGLPPLPEQRAIAHVLRTVQRTKETTDGVIAALKKLKKSLMQHLFTYGPVPATERERVPLQETEIGPIPAHWRVVRLGELVEKRLLLIRGGFPQGQHNEVGNGVPHLRPFNITNDGNLDLSQIKYIAPPSEDDPHWLLPNDVIFNNTNSEELVGKTALFDRNGRFVLSNHMTLLRILEPNQVDASWLSRQLHYFWHLGLYKSLCRRHVNQASISLEQLKGISIPLPPLDEQREIARILQAVDAKIAAEQARRAALEELFKSLLHLLMTGKLRVKEDLGSQNANS